MRDFGVFSNCFELDATIVKELTALFWVFQNEIQTIIGGVKSSAPSEFIIRCVWIFDFCDNNVIFSTDESMFFNKFIVYLLNLKKHENLLSINAFSSIELIVQR